MTPQDLIVTTETFRDIPVRIVQTDKDRLIPLIDIADGLGYDRPALRKIIYRNKAQFEPYSTSAIMASPNGKQYETFCLTRDGVTGLLMRLRSKRIENPDLQKRVVEFQHWVMETIGKVMDGQLRTPPADTQSILRANMQIAQIVSEYSSVSPDIAASAAISHTEDVTGEDLSWLRPFIPKNKSLYLGQLSAGDIGARIGKTAQQVNQILLEMGYQEKIGTEWYPTYQGKLYGEMIPFTIVHSNRSEHSGRHLRWNKEVIEKIQNYRPGLLEGDKGLLAGYLS